MVNTFQYIDNCVGKRPFNLIIGYYLNKRMLFDSSSDYNVRSHIDYIQDYGQGKN